VGKDVARKLVNICVVFALMTGCWVGVFAAAACPHVGCETSAGAPDGAAAHGEHTVERAHHAASPEDHSGRSEAHGEGHSSESPARDQAQPDSDQFRDLASGAHDPDCAHCVGGAEAPLSRPFEWQPNSFKNSGKLTAPRAAQQVSAPAVVVTREITPAQHAPPGRSDRHLLLSVFRI
jgi:hypothetical protein